MSSAQIVIRPDLKIEDWVHVHRNFLQTKYLGAAVDAALAVGQWRGYGPVSTKAQGTVASWKAGCNPPVNWWGLEWAFLDGENHLIRTPDAPRLPSAIEYLRHAVERSFDMDVDMIQVNHYRNGDGLIWHSDLDSRGWTVNKTVTLSVGAPRLLAVAHFPEDWKERKLIGADPRHAELMIEHTELLSTGCATVMPMEGQQSLLHAVIPHEGERFSFTFRQHSVF